MVNEKIINAFETLVKQIAHDIESETDKKKRTVNLFRLKQIGNAVNILKNYPNVIKSGNDLDNIKGIGKGIIGRIDEILSSGNLSEVKMKKKDIEISKIVDELKEIYGIGEKKAYELATKFKVHSIDELIKAHDEGKIKLNNNVVIGLKYHETYKQKIPHDEMKRMEKYIQNMAKQISKKLAVKICGSFRREKPFSNDIDCMLTHPTIKTNDDLENKRNYLQDFIEILKEDMFIIDALTGEDVKTKFMGFCRFNKKLPVRRIDIRYIPMESYYPALLYFTGSGAFNQRMRQDAKKIGYKLNEYGLFKKIGSEYKNIKVNSEEDIFKKLNMEYVAPKDRI